MLHKRSLFRPHDSFIGALKTGKLYPIEVMEMYPNDRIIISHEALLRAAPMLFPLYSPMKLTFDYFYSENRLVWRGDETKDWSTFITGSIDGKPIEDMDDLPEMPYITVPEGGFAAGSLGDFLGFSSNAGLAGAKVSALRFRHYQKIMRDFYADENFSTLPGLALTEGEDTTTSLELFTRCWNKDRFTTATDDPQKGISVGISLTGDIPVVGNGTALGITDGTDNAGLNNLILSNDSNILGARIGSYGLDVGTEDGLTGLLASQKALGITTDPEKSGLVADASDVEPISIDELHFLTQIQRLNQRNNMWGSRDFECILTNFGVMIPDTRLQRATHLGRTVVDVNFSEVLQTSATTDDSAQGNISGHSIAVSANRPVRYLAREHGYLFVICNIQPIAQYQQGIPRDAMYQTRYDYMWPVLSQTGEQEIFTAEVNANATNVANRRIFGFEPRYNHLRFGQKTVHGDFRTTMTGYHAGRIFPTDTETNLGENFIKCDATNRMFAVTDQDSAPWWLRCEFDIKLVRRLPKWPSPSAIGKLF